MSFDQGAILAILLVMLVAYATERFRVEVVALVVVEKPVSARNPSV